jgi:hypothetical protein
MRTLLSKYALEILTGAAAASIVAAAVFWEWRRGTFFAAATAVATLYSFALWRRDVSPPSVLRSKYVSPFSVDCDNTQIVVHLDGVQRESVQWVELSMVAIRIEDEGMLPVPYWLLFGTGSNGCRYPSDAVGNEKLLEALQRRLPGFDNAALVVAMGMLSGGIEVWRRDRSATAQR